MRRETASKCFYVGERAIVVGGGLAGLSAARALSGERRHSENRTATLSTHIEDIVAHIEVEDFQDVILVSQSYGAWWPPARWRVSPPYPTDDLPRRFCPRRRKIARRLFLAGAQSSIYDL